mmetsp:Transcript_103205/g.199975  ORF Transcript_103205/g.199975 Transcript_103205/m.199975 type:complete len:289 (-) Transcript_103205:985-1851(-)
MHSRPDRRGRPCFEGLLICGAGVAGPSHAVFRPGRSIAAAGAAAAAASSAAATTAAQRRPRGGEVQIITFGVENLDEQLLERCWEWRGGGSKIQFPDDDLQAALNRSAPDVGIVDVLVDARCFPDPEAMQYCKHTGHHYGIITRICQHRNFGRWLNSVRARIGEAAAVSAARGDAGPAGPSLTIGVYCRSGKHRSVAAAIILQHVLCRDGWDCRDPRHLSAPRWSSCCKGQCSECRNPSQEVQKQLQDTLDKMAPPRFDLSPGPLCLAGKPSACSGMLRWWPAGARPL